MAKRKSKPKHLEPNPPTSPRSHDDVVLHNNIVDNDLCTADEVEASTSGSDSTKVEHLSPCIFFLYFGKCGNEDACKFSHSPSSIDPRPVSGSTSPLSDDPPQTHKANQSRRPQLCKMFIRGSCKYGSRCKYSHEHPKLLSPSSPKFNGVGRGSSSWGGVSAPRPAERPKANMKGTASAIAATVDELSTGFEESSARIEEFFDDKIGGHYSNASEDAIDQQRTTPPPNDSPPSESLHEVYTLTDGGRPLNDEHSPSLFDSNHVDHYDTDPEADGQSQLDPQSRSEDEEQNQPFDNTHKDRGSVGGSSNFDAPIKVEADEEDSGEDTWGWNEVKGGIKREEVRHGGKEGEESGKVRENVIPEHWDDPSSDDHDIAEEKASFDEPEGVREEGEEKWNDELEYASDKGDAVEEQQESGKIDDVWYQAPGQQGEQEEQGEQELQDIAQDHAHSGDTWDQESEREKEREVESENNGPSLSSLHFTPKLKNEPTPSIKSDKERVPTPALSTPSLNPPPIRAQPSPKSTQTTNVILPDPPQPAPSSSAHQISVVTLHWSRFADPTIDPNLAFCKAFAQNKCSNVTSETCKFRHCITPHEYTLLFKDPQPLQFTLEKHLIRNDSPQDANVITSPSFTLHWSHFADPTCDSNAPFCKAHAEHRCSHDISCMFRHCLTLEEYTLLFKDPQPNLIATGGAASQHQQTTFPPAPAHAVSSQGQAQSAQRPCAFFLRGGCRNGENCLYYHDTSSASCPNIRTRGYCNGRGCLNCSSSPSGNQVHLGAPTKVCQFWPKGTCKNGDSCAFAHVGEPGAAARNDQDEGQPWNNEENTTEENQAEEGWGTHGSANGWDNGEGWGGQDRVQDGNDEEDKGKGKEEEKNEETGWEDYGWGDQNNDASGWGDQNNDTSGRGNQNNDASGWGDQNNGASGWRNKNNDNSGWRNKNNDNSGWRNKNNDNSGWRNKANDSGWGKRNDDGGWGTGRDTNDKAESVNRRSYRRSWNDNRPNTSRKASGICHQFQREGRCSRGSDCRFSHDIQLGESSGRGSRDTSQHQNFKTDSTPAVLPTDDSSPPAPSPGPAASLYGGRHHYDRGFIDHWNREVAASSADSEAGGSRDIGRHGGSSSQHRSRSRGRGHNIISSNRSVKNHPAGNGSCQFYLLGCCSNGDTCPSFHDPAAAGIKADITIDEENRQESHEKRRSRYRCVDSGGKRRVVEGDAREKDMDEDECTPHAENEEITANDDDASAQHHVVDSKWGLDDQWDDNPIEVPKEEIRVDKPCLYYGQGFCGAGKNCRYLHIDPEQSSPERSVEEEVQTAPPEGQDSSETGTRDQVTQVDPREGAEARDYGHPLVEKSIFGCAVIFNRDCFPEKVTTGTDSQTLLLKGPPTITEARVHDVVNKYGAVEDIVITQGHPEQDEDVTDDEQGGEEEDSLEVERAPLPTSTIRVDFKDAKDAAAAARGLNGTLANALVVEPAHNMTTWLRLRWPQATRAAWVFYSTVPKAKAMADKLHGTIFQNRKIAASFLRPDKKAKDLYAIKLEGLPASTSKESLKDMVQDAKLVTISELTYIDNPREILQRFEGLKAFMDVPEDPSKIHAVAFARFDSEESMLQALNMHGAKPKFLGKQELVVERVWFAHYTLPSGAFKAISTKVVALHIQCEGRAFVESFNTGEHYIVYVYSPQEEKTAFAKANLSLQAICHGTIVMTAENRTEWDDYFYTTSSAKVIESLNARDNFYIFPSTSTRQIHILGSGSDQDKGISTVKKLLQKVRASCQVHPIHRNAIRQLVNGGLSEVQDSVGANKLSLDVLRSVLVVRGGDKVLMQKIRHILEFSPSSENSDRSNCSDQLCSICELQPGDDDCSPAVKLFCGHVYCMACLQHALIFATHNHSAPIGCIGQQPVGGGKDAVLCTQPIAYTTARDLLPLLVEPEYFKIAFTSFVLCRSDEYFFCPSLHCDAVYRHGAPGDNVRCPICRAWICLFCGSMTHDGMDCKEAQETRNTICN